MQNAAGSDTMGVPAALTIEHGGRLAEIGRRFPNAPAPWIDLSTGINPIAYDVGDLPQTAWTRLPEPDDVSRLQRQAALAYRAGDPAMVVAAPGTQILISLLPHVLPYRSVRVLGPTYGEHLAAWRNAGAVAVEVGEIADLRRAECAVVCNPNNPDGRAHDPAALQALAETMTASGGLLIVDEAFCDFVPELGAAPLLTQAPVLVLRSFGKAYGLAGLRLGFALAAPGLATRLRTALGPWAVSGISIAIGTRALGDHAWRTAAEARLRADGAKLDTALIQAGLSLVGGTALFRLAHTKRAPEIFDRLCRAGILVRRFETSPHRLRFGIPGTQHALDRLRAALSTT